MPWLVSTAAARMDRGLAVLAVGAGPIGRDDLHNDPDCRNFLTCARLAVAHCCRLCLWVLGISVNLCKHRICQRTRLSCCALSAAREVPIVFQPPSVVSGG